MHLNATTNKKGKVRAVIMAVLAFAVLLATPGITPAAAQSDSPGFDARAVDDLRAGENRRLFAEDDREARGWDAPGVAVNPSDANHIVAVAADLLEFECSFTTTFDAGNTWTPRVDFEAPAGFPDRPCDPRSHGPTSSDQAVSFGSGDNVYAAFAATADAGGGQSSIVVKSTDGGATFETGVLAMPGVADVASYRFPKVVAEAGAGTAGQDRVYVVADNGELGQIAVSVSNDGGTTWGPPVSASSAVEGATESTHPVVGPDGAVYVGFIERTFFATIFVSKSTDGGLTWAPTVVETDVNGYQNPDSQFSGSIFPSLAVDNSDTETSGNLYVTWQQGPLGEGPPAEPGARDHFIHPDADVFVSSSTDANASWSAPVKVNDDVPVDNFHQVRHPNVAVAPNGRVDVVWHDRRHWYLGCQHTHGACDEGRLGDTYYANSTDGGATFSEDRRITDRSINNDVGFDYRFGHYWSFGPRAVALGGDHIFVTWMESRNGNFDNDAADIYYSRVNVESTGDAPVKRVPVATTGDLAVDMSRMAYPGGSEGILTSTFATEAVTRVVIVPEGDHAAALAGGVLARAHLGSLLVAPAAGLSDEAKSEVDRLDPIGAFIIGDETALSAQIVDDLTGAGVPATELDDEGAETSAIVRFTGSPAEIAADIALSLDRRNELQTTNNDPAFNAVIVANPEDPAATSASALAAAERLPVLYVEGGEVPAATSDAMAQLDIDTTLVIGNEAAVSAGAASGLPGVTRLGGADIAATSRLVVEESLERGLPSNMVYVARDADDAAIMGGAVGRLIGLLVVASDPASAQSVATDLGLQVDQLVAPGALSTRGELTNACPIGELPTGAFTDVGDNVHAQGINCVAWYEIALGGPGGIDPSLYGPFLDVRRDQMASFIARMIDHADPDALGPAPAGNVFPCDVATDNAHFDNIQRLAAAGIVLGAPDGLAADCYGPERQVKRDQMASFINRAIAEVSGDPLVAEGDLFTDDSDSVHEENINAVASEGIVVGQGGGIYDPFGTVRRDQMASFIARTMDFFVQSGEAFPPINLL